MDGDRAAHAPGIGQAVVSEHGTCEVCSTRINPAFRRCYDHLFTEGCGRCGGVVLHRAAACDACLNAPLRWRTGGGTAAPRPRCSCGGHASGYEHSTDCKGFDIAGFQEHLKTQKVPASEVVEERERTVVDVMNEVGEQREFLEERELIRGGSLSEQATVEYVQKLEAELEELRIEQLGTLEDLA